jgi:hypothetical protein
MDKEGCMLRFTEFTRTFPSTAVIRKHWPSYEQPVYAEVVKLRRLINKGLFASFRKESEKKGVIAKGTRVVWRIFRAEDGARILVGGRPDLEPEIASELRALASKGITYFNKYEIVVVGDEVVLRQKKSNVVLFDPYFRYWNRRRG